jgi:hypothetical protein
MKRRNLRLPSPAMVVAIIALSVGLAGGAYAAGVKLGKGTVSAKALKKNAVTTKKIQDGAVTTPKLAPSARGTAVAYAVVSANGDVIEDKSKGITDAMVTKPGGAAGVAFCLHSLPESGTAAVSGVYDSSFEFEGWPTIAVAKAPLPDVDCQTVAGTQYEVMTAQGDTNNTADANDPAAFSIVLFR